MRCVSLLGGSAGGVGDSTLEPVSRHCIREGDVRLMEGAQEACGGLMALRQGGQGGVGPARAGVCDKSTWDPLGTREGGGRLRTWLPPFLQAWVHD